MGFYLFLAIWGTISVIWYKEMVKRDEEAQEAEKWI